jgi:glycosyltransferase involved in cell wall biosynthesis
LPKGVSVVIPAYNEQDGIRGVVDHVGKVLADMGAEYEVIVVDDGSSDNTCQRAREVCATVLRHPSNRGYGAALKTGIRSAKYELICILDADGTYPVEEFPRLIAACAGADMVVGARTGRKVHIPLLRRPAKCLLNTLANFLTATKIPDLNSGMRVLRPGLVLEYMDILPDRFSFTTTITLAGLCDGYRVEFLPIEYKRRIGSSKIKPVDALNFLILILRTMSYFRPLRMFAPLALLLFTVGFGKLLMDFYYVNVKGTSVLFCLAAVHVLSLGIVADLVCFLRRRRGPFRGPGQTHPVGKNGQAELSHDDLSSSTIPETRAEARAKEEAAG